MKSQCPILVSQPDNYIHIINFLRYPVFYFLIDPGYGYDDGWQIISRKANADADDIVQRQPLAFIFFFNFLNLSKHFNPNYQT